jgi:hypothetical protein
MAAALIGIHSLLKEHTEIKNSENNPVFHVPGNPEIEVNCRASHTTLGPTHNLSGSKNPDCALLHPGYKLTFKIQSNH